MELTSTRPRGMLRRKERYKLFSSLAMRLDQIAVITIPLFYLPAGIFGVCYRNGTKCKWVGTWPACIQPPTTIPPEYITDPDDERILLRVASHTKDLGRDELCIQEWSYPGHPGKSCCLDYGLYCLPKKAYKVLGCEA
ncbi:hypothetical protein XA68_15538 [Ophiocordyceps unilateralis]|uniref:Uncharacterized protein n=1 Tax=Ophiocordyceps unilateralis TaxID=268505 RepID=A0A2A9PMF1_OPHUN|nr:hypothetical protein XA68_15538 [Ophiocordyceps unilateralis]